MRAKKIELFYNQYVDIGAPEDSLSLMKASIRDALVDHLRAELETLRRYATETREAATHEEAKAENDKDTRGLEQSYLARGQVMRVEEADEAIKRLRFMEISNTPRETIGIGGLIELVAYDDEDDEQGTEMLLFMTPTAGGVSVTVDGRDITAISPAAPLGRALIDKRAGDEIELQIARRTRIHSIIRVF